jgi:hypothetical protein
MSTLTNLCNCCDDCYSQVLYECPDFLEFDLGDIPDQTVVLYLINLATNRVIVTEGEVVDGEVSFDVSEINFAQDQTYKSHIRDSAGKVITFDYDDESFNCYQLRYEPVYVN